MSPRTLLNLGLATAAVLAAAALYLAPRSTPAPAYALIETAADELRSIEISRRESESLVLSRSDRHWYLVAPLRARVDELAIARLLELLDVRSATRMSVTDRLRFALDSPWAQVRFDGRTLAFGTINEVTQELYVGTSDYVYAIPARHASAIPAHVSKLLSHRLLAAGEIPVSFRLERFSVRHDGTRWRVEPGDEALSQDDLIRWVEQWRLASSIVTQPPPDSEAAGETIAIALRDGRTIPLRILRRAPELVLLREDEALEYRFTAALARTLLEPPGVAER